jgi:glycerol-3-phosphate O-acyltransferase/dihydroxyacetone phosphate acyltransferase
MQRQPLNRPRLVPWIYDLLLHVFSACLDIFFREIYPRSTWKIPKRDAVIIVAAPHANQFVDSVLLMRILKQHAGRRVSFLIAEKSLREPYVGPLASRMGALPVTRAMDNVRPGKGEIFLVDPTGDTALLGGHDVNFTKLSVGSLIVLPKSGSENPEQQAIAEIMGPEALRLKGPFKASNAGEPLHEKLLSGIPYKVAPHVDQSEMYDAVFRSLSGGGCIGIFPEGGSHDRPSMLPLKAGVAIIALGALARDPNINLTILPCGLNYFNPHKFHSRAVVEFGDPVKVSPDQVAAFKQGKEAKREAVGALLNTIQDALGAVTQQAPDYETLALVQATRRLYRPLRMKLPLPVVVEMNRKLMAGYTEHKDEPKVVQLKQAVLDYNRRLRAFRMGQRKTEAGMACAADSIVPLRTTVDFGCRHSTIPCALLADLHHNKNHLYPQTTRRTGQFRREAKGPRRRQYLENLSGDDFGSDAVSLVHLRGDSLAPPLPTQRLLRLTGTMGFSSGHIRQQ